MPNLSHPSAVLAASLLLALSGPVAGVAQTLAQPSRVLITAERLGIAVNRVEDESERIGPANQPEWSARRAFAETDVYVIPPGEVEVNQFYISSHPHRGKPENRFASEFEFGLPWRTQFDVELDTSVRKGRGHYDSTLVELPHALADWGKLPLNPTVDAGWRFNERAPDAFFFRLLLAEEFGRRVHFGANLTFDRQIGGPRQTAFEFNQAASYVVVNRRLTLGYELRVELERERAETDGEAAVGRFPAGPGSGADAVDEAPRPARRGRRLDKTTRVLLGPSLLWKPTRDTHLAFVPLFGLTHDSPRVEAFVIFGVDFGPFGAGGNTGRDEGGEIEAGRPRASRRR